MILIGELNLLFKINLNFYKIKLISVWNRQKAWKNIQKAAWMKLKLNLKLLKKKSKSNIYMFSFNVSFRNKKKRNAP